MMTRKSFEWVVPHLPGDKNIYVTASRMQHAPQANRLWILPQLFRAQNFNELTTQLYKLVVERGKSKIPSEIWFRKLFFDEKTGLIDHKKTSLLIKKLKIAAGYENEIYIKRIFTKEDLKKQLEFYRNNNKKDGISNKNEILFKTTLSKFDQVSKKVYIDANGNICRNPRDTYKKLDAVKIGDSYYAIKLLQALSLKNRIPGIFGDKDFKEICEKIGLPSEKQTPQDIVNIVAPRSEKKMFNAKTIYIKKPEEAYRIEHIVELPYIKSGETQEKSYINPSDARYILDQVFSSVGRSAGGRLAGVPLTTLHKDKQGIKVKDADKIDDEIRLKYVYGKKSGENTFSVKKKIVEIGQPYTDRLIESAKLITQAVDVVARYLDLYIKANKSSQKQLFSVEKLSEYALKNLKSWLKEAGAFTYNGIRSRTHQNMDFFFLPDKEVRKKIISDVVKNNGYFSGKLKKILRNETLKGNLKLAVLDISAGAGTTGLSEFVAKLLKYKGSGSMDTYIDSMVSTFKAKYGKKPTSISITPRIDDLTLATTEYLPAVESIEKHGMKAYIILAEQLEKSLKEWDGHSRFTTITWDEKTVAPELVAKRFTFLGAGLDGKTDRGYIRADLPDGVMIIPSPASRIPASDKRVNSKILGLLESRLKKFGGVVIPTEIIKVVDREKMQNMDYKLERNGKDYLELKRLRDQYVDKGILKAVGKIIKFAKKNINEWPEIGFLGLILKLDDKRPGRAGKGGELVSTYPIPAGILVSKDLEENRFYRKEILDHRIKDLIDKGVYDIVIQPNLLTAFANGEDFMEVKLFVYTKLKND